MREQKVEVYSLANITPKMAADVGHDEGWFVVTMVVYGGGLTVVYEREVEQTDTRFPKVTTRNL